MAPAAEVAIFTAVATPNKLPVNAFVLNTLAVPVLDVAILGRWGRGFRS